MFRFTIRDLLWLMVVVALMAGWIDQYRRRAAVDNHAFRLKLALQLARDYAKRDGEPLPDDVWWELADAPIPWQVYLASQLPTLNHALSPADIVNSRR